MRRMVETILRQYGTEISFGNQTVRGFFQPVTGKVERLALAQMGPLGRENKKRYVYIGPVEPAVAEDETLVVLGTEYLVRSVQQIQGMDGPAYIWAMCVEKGGEAHWAMNG